MKCTLAYGLIALLHNHSHAFTVVPGNDTSYSIVDASHVRLASRTDGSSMPILFDSCCTCSVSAQPQNISCVSSQVRESASPQSAECIRLTEQLIELSSISAICHSHAVDFAVVANFYHLSH